MSNQPPRLGQWLLRMICSDEHFEEVSGDMEEIYQDRLQSKGKFKANILYIRDALMSARNLRLFRMNRAMTLNLVTIAYRSLRKRLSYTLLNIAGLATSMSCAFLLWMYVHDQTSYDKDFINFDRVYRVNLEANMNGKVDVYANIAQPVAGALKSAYTQIEDVAKVAIYNDRSGTLEFNGKHATSLNFAIAEPSIIKMFDKEFIEGDPKTALLDPGSIVINRSMAEDLFGSIDVTGKVVHYKEGKKDFKITGVIEDDYRHSHFPMDVIIPWNAFEENNFDRWYGGHAYVYVLLNSANDIEGLQQQMPAFFERFMKKTFDDFGGTGKVILQPVKEIHLAPELVWEPSGHGSSANVLALSIVAILLITFAVINYINLATAQAGERAAEVSIRKVMGSSRQMLWAQFFSESVLLAMSAGVLALMLAWMLLPFFSRVSGIAFDSYKFFTVVNIRTVLLMSLGIGLLAGIFPAIYLSESSAVNLLKGKFVVSPAGEILRRILVTTQYFIAAVLISGILLVYNQVVFIKTKEIGFQRENLVNIRFPRDSAISNHIRVYMEEIKTSSKVISASLAHLDLHSEANSFSPVLQNEDGSQFRMGADIMHVDSDFMNTIGATLTAGRQFDKTRPTDGDSYVMLNEAAVKKFGWTKNPLGGKFIAWTHREEDTDIREIVGVVKDFHLGVSYQLVHPTIIFFTEGIPSNLYVRISPGETKETLAMMKSVWAKYFPDHKIEYSFVDQDLTALYNREDNFLSLLSCLCVVIVFIASLGIIGLISYTTQLRKREIAIRKVLGSSFNSIVKILTKKFVFLLILANLLAIIPTWYITGLWLSNFAYRVNVGPETFLAPFAVCVLFTALSIAFHTVRAAFENPVTALKCE